MGNIDHWGGGLKIAAFLIQKFGVEVSTCTCVIEIIQTARAKYCFLSFIRVSKEVAKQPSNVRVYTHKHTYQTKIWSEMPNVNLPVNNNLDNGKNIAASFFISSIVPEGYLVSWYQCLE